MATLLGFKVYRNGKQIAAFASRKEASLYAAQVSVSSGAMAYVTDGIGLLGRYVNGSPTPDSARAYAHSMAVAA